MAPGRLQVKWGMAARRRRPRRQACACGVAPTSPRRRPHAGSGLSRGVVDGRIARRRAFRARPGACARGVRRPRRRRCGRALRYVRWGGPPEPTVLPGDCPCVPGVNGSPRADESAGGVRHPLALAADDWWVGKGAEWPNRRWTASSGRSHEPRASGASCRTRGTVLPVPGAERRGLGRAFDDLRRSKASRLRPAFLTDTAWRTALATGALTHMEYETVARLSALYTAQQRFVG